MKTVGQLPESFRPDAVAPGTSNMAAQGVPFQRWFNFKEAFAPSFVEEVIQSAVCPIERCFDPFGGSGTTALTCQFLGVYPVTAEVNPFLADLIEAKLFSYDPEVVLEARVALARRLESIVPPGEDYFPGAPETFVEPGVNGRWIFDDVVASRIAQYRAAIDQEVNPSIRRLFTVLLGSILVGVSNVTISGKGRRYRQNWAAQRRSSFHVDENFNAVFLEAYRDICAHTYRPCGDYDILRGDCRTLIREIEPVDLVLFSPPYPNSFDYTDIYNIELWSLGYLSGNTTNRALREATLRSHVQIKRDFASGDQGSPTLASTLHALLFAIETLWNVHIPSMVAAYFEDIATVLSASRAKLTPGGEIAMVVGDSRYAGVKVDVPMIVTEMAPMLGLQPVEVREVRSMRSSPQHGGRFDLNESLIRLIRQ